MHKDNSNRIPLQNIGLVKSGESIRRYVSKDTYIIDLIFNEATIITLLDIPAVSASQAKRLAKEILDKVFIDHSKYILVARKIHKGKENV